jgi:hypothetical protein
LGSLRLHFTLACLTRARSGFRTGFQKVCFPVLTAFESVGLSIEQGIKTLDAND